MSSCVKAIDAVHWPRDLGFDGYLLSIVGMHFLGCFMGFLKAHAKSEEGIGHWVWICRLESLKLQDDVGHSQMSP